MDLISRLILSFSFRFHLFISFLLRVILIFYADYQDNNFLVKYTDVDYRVYSDAAKRIFISGGSPYDRHTYRYTPVLAWMLYPNVTVTPLFGKFLFAAFDVASGALIYR